MLDIFMHYTPPHFHSANLQHSTCKYMFSIIVEKTVDLDQMASWEAIWSGSTVFSNKGQIQVQQDQGQYLFL